VCRYDRFSTTQPFNCTVQFTDGTTRAFATRERPHVIFADANRTTPMGVITAVSSQVGGDSTCVGSVWQGVVVIAQRMDAH